MNIRHAVIMCIYIADNASFVKLAIESIINQTVSNHLYIYLDGPIAEDVHELLKRYQSNQSIFIIDCQENHGLAYGLNYLINQALANEYDFISRMDSDDISIPNRLYLQEKFLDFNKNIDIVGGYCSEFGSDYAMEVKKVPLTQEKIIIYSALRCPFIHPTVMFRSKIFLSNIRYPVNTSYSEDLALWFILLKKGYQFANIPHVLLKYRTTDDTLVRRRGFKKAKSEFFLRYGYMKTMNLLSPSRLFFLVAKFLFHIMPVYVTRFFYKRMR